MDTMNGWGTAGLVALAAGIIASVAGAFLTGGIFIIVSLILSVISVIAADNKGVAIAQIVFGLIGTCIFIVHALSK